jgi:hypothetical protein
LSEDQLERVAGGAIDSFLKYGGVQGETEMKYVPAVPAGWDLATNKKV